MMSSNNSGRLVFTTALTLLLATIIGTVVSFQPLFTIIILISLLFLVFTIRYTTQAFFIGFAFIVFEGLILSFFSNGNIEDIIGLIPEIIFILVLSLLFFRNSFSIPKLNLFDYLIGLVIVWSILISIINDNGLLLTIFGLRIFFRFLMIYWIVRLMKFSKEELLQKIMKFLSLVVFFQFLVITFQLVTKMLIGASSINTFGNNLVMSHSLFGLQGTFNRYDMLGMFLGFSSIILLGYYLYFQRKNVYLLAYFISLFGIVISTSRQAIVVLAIGTLILVSSSLKKVLRNKASMIFIYFLILVGIFAFIFWPDSTNFGDGRNPFDLIMSLFEGSTYSTEKNKNFRLYFIIEIGGWLINNHYWGMGLGTFGANFSFEQFKGLYLSLGLNDNFLNYISDVNWVSILGQIGVIGLMGFAIFLLLFFFTSFYRGKKNKDGILIIASAITITWAISGFFGPNFEIKSNAMFFWLFLGLALKNNLQERKSEEIN